MTQELQVYLVSAAATLAVIIGIVIDGRNFKRLKAQMDASLKRLDHPSAK